MGGGGGQPTVIKLILPSDNVAICQTVLHDTWQSTVNFVPRSNSGRFSVHLTRFPNGRRRSPIPVEHNKRERSTTRAVIYSIRITRTVNVAETNDSQTQTTDDGRLVAIETERELWRRVQSGRRFTDPQLSARNTSRQQRSH